MDLLNSPPFSPLGWQTSGHGNHDIRSTGKEVSIQMMKLHLTISYGTICKLAWLPFDIWLNTRRHQQYVRKRWSTQIWRRYSPEEQKWYQTAGAKIQRFEDAKRWHSFDNIARRQGDMRWRTPMVHHSPSTSHFIKQLVSCSEGAGS